MAQAQVTICNKKGLHARAAAKLVKTAATFDAQVKVIRLSPSGTPEGSAAATSVLSLLMLAADLGSQVELQATGTQAEEALIAITDLIARRFDEGE